MAYKPAITSSSMTPQPAGSQFSASLTGLGLRMSKRRKRAKPVSNSYQWSPVQGRKTIHWPRSSSITTLPGSFSPSSFSAWEAHTLPPIKRRARVRSLVGKERGKKQKGTARVAASEPIVPGALGKSPIGPSVANKVREREKKRFFAVMIWICCGGPTRG